MTEQEKLICAYGYEPIESKNPYMRSYANEKKRINYYFTSLTIQIQEFDKKLSPGKILRKVTDEELESYL